MPNVVQIVALVVAAGLLVYALVSFVLKVVKRRNGKKRVDSSFDDDTEEKKGEQR